MLSMVRTHRTEIINVLFAYNQVILQLYTTLMDLKSGHQNVIKFRLSALTRKTKNCIKLLGITEVAYLIFHEKLSRYKVGS